MLRTCERALRAGMMNAPSSSPSGKRSLCWPENSPQKRNWFSNLSFFNCLRLADNDSWFDVVKGTVNLMRDAIFFTSDNKILTCGS